MIIDLKTALALYREKIAEKYGSEELEPGDKIVSVFDNCTMIVSMDDNKEVRVELVGGKPFYINGSLDIYKEEN